MIIDDEFAKLNHQLKTTLKDGCDSMVVSTNTLAALVGELERRVEADRAIWQNAPEWADWYAQDADGREFWFENRPIPDVDGVWRAYPEGQISLLNIQTRWQSTLQERPK